MSGIYMQEYILYIILYKSGYECNLIRIQCVQYVYNVYNVYTVGRRRTR